MSHPVCEAFDVLEPEFPPALFSSSSLSALRSVIPILAPVCAVQLGFECRLSAEIPRVDLLQCLIASRGHIQSFLNAIDAFDASSFAQPPSAAVWERIRDLCVCWCDAESSFSRGLHDIWLEFDVEAATSSRPIPSLFVGISPDLRGGQERFRIAEESLVVLGAEAAGHPTLRRNLQHCFEMCQGQAVVSHVGIMLARPIPVVRVCVQRLSVAEMLAYLRDVQWPGDMAQVEELLQTLEPMVDEIHLILDVGEGCITYPRLGLECFLAWGQVSATRWETFSQWLVEQGLCSPEKRQALLDWRRPIMPPETSVPWPETLIAESLLAPSEKLIILDRQINHVKLDIVSVGQLEAKAYLGAGREWGVAAESS